MSTVGVLALQGDVVEHIHALERAGADVVEVRTPEDLARVDALVVPGGESTTVIRLLDRFGLTEPIKRRVAGGMPFWGTCMGMIVAAHDVADIEQPTLDLLDVTVRRNAFGRQLDSAEVPLSIPALGDEPFPAVFIRAPWIERAGPNVETSCGNHNFSSIVKSHPYRANMSPSSEPIRAAFASAAAAQRSQSFMK